MKDCRRQSSHHRRQYRLHRHHHAIREEMAVDLAKMMVQIRQTHRENRYLDESEATLQFTE